MRILNAEEVKEDSRIGAVQKYLDNLSDKSIRRRKVQIHFTDVSRPISDGGLGWNIPIVRYNARRFDTSPTDFHPTGVDVKLDAVWLCEKLREESENRGYSLVFWVSRGFGGFQDKVYAGREYPENERR